MMNHDQWWNWQLITESLALRYLMDLVSMIVLTRFIYYRIYRKTNLISSFFVFNSIIFFVTYMLNMVEMSTGAAFGLFAVFSILRYRTDGISTRDMTYLFMSIAIGLLNSVSKGLFTEILCLNLVLILLIFVLEHRMILKRESSKVILYDNIQYIRPEQQQLLIEDLKNKTGLDIKRIIISDIDFIKECCSVTIYYMEEKK